MPFVCCSAKWVGHPHTTNRVGLSNKGLHDCFHHCHWRSIPMYRFLFISVKKGFTVINNKEFLSQVTCWINQQPATGAKVNEQQPCSTWRKSVTKKKKIYIYIFVTEHTIKCGSYHVRLVTSSPPPKKKCGGQQTVTNLISG